MLHLQYEEPQEEILALMELLHPVAAAAAVPIVVMMMVKPEAPEAEAEALVVVEARELQDKVVVVLPEGVL
jgi:hypothetical protein